MDGQRHREHTRLLRRYLNRCMMLTVTMNKRIGSTGNASYANQSNQASYTPANSVPVIDPVAQVLQVERRRGREDKMAAPTVTEVKQADLTGGKLREDQLRTTGIAFRASYQVKLNALFQVLVSPSHLAFLKG